MAVERPHAGIVSRELEDNVASRAQHLRVSALGIRRVDDGRAVPLLVQDLEIMPVQVKGLNKNNNMGKPVSFFDFDSKYPLIFL